MTRNAKNNTKSRSYPIVLKTLINEICDDYKSRNETFNDDAKRIRAKIRANKSIDRIMNTSHVIRNDDEYNMYRSTIDARYANELIARIQRETQCAQRERNAKRNARKNNTQSNDTIANVESE